MGEHHYNNIMLESNSLSIIKYLKGVWKIPWEIIDIVENTQDIMQQVEIRLKHIFREGNQVVDLLANTAIEQGGKLQVWGFSQLPSQARKLINIDKQ